MERGRRMRLSPASVIATVALFVALSGTAVAVTDNSVDSKDISPGAVKSSDVKDDGIKGKDVREPTLEGVGTGAFMGRIKGLGEGPYAYVSPSGTSRPAADASGVEYVSPVNGKVDDLVVHLTNGVSGDVAGRQFILQINGKTELSCTIENGSDCETRKQSANVQRGDRLAIFVFTSSGAPTTDALFAWQLTQ
jgi:hypothetical protein